MDGLEGAAQLIHVEVVAARRVGHGVARPPAPAVVPEKQRVMLRRVGGARPVDKIDERLGRAHVGRPPVGYGVLGGGGHALRDVEDAGPGPRAVDRVGEPPAIGQGHDLHVGVGADRRHLLVDVVRDPRLEIGVGRRQVLIAVHVDHHRPGSRRRGARRRRLVGRRHTRGGRAKASTAALATVTAQTGGRRPVCPRRGCDPGPVTWTGPLEEAHRPSFDRSPAAGPFRGRRTSLVTIVQACARVKPDAPHRTAGSRRRGRARLASSRGRTPRNPWTAIVRAERRRPAAWSR